LNDDPEWNRILVQLTAAKNLLFTFLDFTFKQPKRSMTGFISLFLWSSLSTRTLLISSHRLTLDLWLVKDNRFLNPKSSYERILTAPPCRLICISLFEFYFLIFLAAVLFHELRLLMSDSKSLSLRSC
jgi:hypothetical protein